MEPDDLPTAASLTDTPADDTEPAADFEPTPAGLSDEEYVRRLSELENCSPPFDFEAHRLDCLWLMELQTSGQLEPYQGKYVAILDRRIVWVGTDYRPAEIDLARRYNVHPQRVMIEYVHRPHEWYKGMYQCPPSG